MHLSVPSSGWRRERASLLVVAVATPLLSVTLQGTAHGSVAEPAPAHDDPSARHKVTLVTGDVVTLTTLADGRQIADVKRPSGALGGVRMHESGGDLYVIPEEAVGLLGAHELDPRLFDVTGLVEMGYDHAGTRTVPLIAEYTRA